MKSEIKNMYEKNPELNEPINQNTFDNMIECGEDTERNKKATDSDSEYKNVICDICGKIFSVEKSLESDEGGIVQVSMEASAKGTKWKIQKR